MSIFGIIPVVLGLFSALTWGAADFSGGLASRHSSAYGVVIGGQATGLALLLALVNLTGEPVPSLSSWLWGGAAGLCGGVGMSILYRALADGRMSVAAPVSALLAGIIPVLVGTGTEGLPELWTLLGFALALAAIWLISRGEDGAAIRLKELVLPLAAGLTFGLFFVFMHQASRVSVLWPIVASRLTSITSLLVYALVKKQPWRPKRALWPLVALSGVLDIGGNSFYILAGQIGRMDVAAVLGSLYPGSTVALARLVLKERIARLQAVGILLALAAITLIAL
ncbi:MAG: DMT family transporter [Anaerolineales bacterium]|nr:DMT family transporter [Anaerolineales bacterium]